MWEPLNRGTTSPNNSTRRRKSMPLKPIRITPATRAARGVLNRRVNSSTRRPTPHQVQSGTAQFNAVRPNQRPINPGVR